MSDSKWHRRYCLLCPFVDKARAVYSLFAIPIASASKYSHPTSSFLPIQYYRLRASRTDLRFLAYESSITIPSTSLPRLRVAGIGSLETPAENLVRASLANSLKCLQLDLPVSFDELNPSLDQGMDASDACPSSEQPGRSLLRLHLVDPSVIIGESVDSRPSFVRRMGEIVQKMKSLDPQFSDLHNSIAFPDKLKIAFCGRMNCGKSSCANHQIGIPNICPVMDRCWTVGPWVVRGLTRVGRRLNHRHQEEEGLRQLDVVMEKKNAVSAASKFVRVAVPQSHYALELKLLVEAMRELREHAKKKSVVRGVLRGLKKAFGGQHRQQQQTASLRRRETAGVDEYYLSDTDSEEESEGEEENYVSQVVATLGDLSQYKDRVIVEVDHPNLQFVTYCDLPGLNEHTELDSLCHEELVTASIVVFVTSGSEGAFSQLDKTNLELISDRVEGMAGGKNIIPMENRLVIAVNKCDLAVPDYCRQRSGMSYSKSARTKRRGVHLRQRSDALRGVQDIFPSFDPNDVLMVCSGGKALKLRYYQNLAIKFRARLVQVLEEHVFRTPAQNHLSVALRRLTGVYDAHFDMKRREMDQQQIIEELEGLKIRVQAISDQFRSGLTNALMSSIRDLYTDETKEEFIEETKTSKLQVEKSAFDAEEVTRRAVHRRIDNLLQNRTIEYIKRTFSLFEKALRQFYSEDEALQEHLKPVELDALLGFPSSILQGVSTFRATREVKGLQKALGWLKTRFFRDSDSFRQKCVTRLFEQWQSELFVPEENAQKAARTFVLSSALVEGALLKTLNLRTAAVKEAAQTLVEKEEDEGEINEAHQKVSSVFTNPAADLNLTGLLQCEIELLSLRSEFFEQNRSCFPPQVIQLLSQKGHPTLIQTTTSSGMRVEEEILEEELPDDLTPELIEPEETRNSFEVLCWSRSQNFNDSCAIRTFKSDGILFSEESILREVHIHRRLNDGQSTVGRFRECFRQGGPGTPLCVVSDFYPLTLAKVIQLPPDRCSALLRLKYAHQILCGVQKLRSVGCFRRNLLCLDTIHVSFDLQTVGFPNLGLAGKAVVSTDFLPPCCVDPTTTIGGLTAEDPPPVDGSVVDMYVFGILFAQLWENKRKGQKPSDVLRKELQPVLLGSSSQGEERQEISEKCKRAIILALIGAAESPVVFLTELHDLQFLDEMHNFLKKLNDFVKGCTVLSWAHRLTFEQAEQSLTEIIRMIDPSFNVSKAERSQSHRRSSVVRGKVVLGSAPVLKKKKALRGGRGSRGKGLFRGSLGQQERDSLLRRSPVAFEQALFVQRIKKLGEGEE